MPLSASAGEPDAPDAQPDSPAASYGAAPQKYYIPWTFNTYEEPSLTSGILGRYEPQDVSLEKTTDDGWALISTEQGPSWTYLTGDKMYIDKDTPIYENMGDTEPISSIEPQIVNIIERVGDWLLIDTWSGDRWLDLDAIRTSVLLDVPAYNQRTLGYYSGCEIVSFAMMVNYETAVDVDTLVAEMPLSDDPYEGFCGDPTVLSSGFTIFPSALTGLADEYLGQAKDMTGCGMDDLKKQLNDTCPIVLWVAGLGFHVHAVCLAGYNEEGFFYNDPWRGSKDAFITYDDFYDIWTSPIIDIGTGISYSDGYALSYVK